MCHLRTWIGSPSFQSCPSFQKWWINVVVVIVVAIAALEPTETKAQIRSDPTQLNPQEPFPNRLQRTYGGRVYMSFPNYDVMLYGAPHDISGLTQGTENEWIPQMNGELLNRTFAGGSVMSRNAQGFRWDGTGFFLHPAYPAEDVTRYRHPNRLVGEPQQQWPTDTSHPPEHPHKHPFPLEPIVTHQEPSVGEPTFPIRETTLRFPLAPWVMNKMPPPSESPTEPECAVPMCYPQQPTADRATVGPTSVMTQFLPAPWVVRTDPVPLTAPAPTEESAETPGTLRPTSAAIPEYGSQPQVKATNSTSPRQRKGIRHQRQGIRPQRAPDDWLLPEQYPSR